MTLNVKFLPLPIIIALGLLPADVGATVTVQQLTPSVAAPQPVGTTVVWTVSATDTNPGPLSYRFRVGFGGSFSTLRDYSLSNSFEFTPSGREGTYSVQVTARDLTTGETSADTVTYQITSLVVQGKAAVTATSNPLVVLFSAPPCPAGSFVSAIFWQPSPGPFTRTNWKACNVGSSNNFYLAGMRPNQTYKANYQLATGLNIVSGPTNLAFTTGALPTNIAFPAFTLPVAATAQSDPTNTMILHASLPPSFPVATDLKGNIVWYYPKAAANPAGLNALLPRLSAGGVLNLIVNGVGSVNANLVLTQVLRQADLAGNTIRETNASRISEQLTAMGTDAITCMHHEAVGLPNGYTAIFGTVERLYPPGTQGSTSPSPVDILGDMVVVLDQDWQVSWFWNSFDHLDVNRAAVLGETCANGQPGCPPLSLASVGNDWTHANSIHYEPLDGSLLVSVRHQDWVLKIDYHNGAGSKNILWRLGNSGDFTMTSSDPYPWFSHQHNAGFEGGGNTVLSLFDNGNTRRTVIQNANSRGQVLSINEANKTASLLVNVDLGVYGFALGSAQEMPNGNFSFQPGVFPFGGNPTFSQTIQIANGTTQVLNLQGPSSYRSFTIPNLYTPALK